MKYLKKLRQIIDGYTNLILDNHKEIAYNRAKICADCKVNKDGFCDEEQGGCGCLISAKIRCLDCECPKKYW